MGQAHPRVIDETLCEWMTDTMRKGVQHIPNFSPTQACVMICDQVRDTEKHVRFTRGSIFTPHPVHDFRTCLYAKSVKTSIRL